MWRGAVHSRHDQNLSFTADLQGKPALPGINQQLLKVHNLCTHLYSRTYSQCHAAATAVCNKSSSHNIEQGVTADLMRMSLMPALVVRHFCTRSSTLANRAEPNRALPCTAPVLPLFLEGDALRALPADSAESESRDESESDMDTSTGCSILMAASCST